MMMNCSQKAVDSSWQWWKKWRIEKCFLKTLQRSAKSPIITEDSYSWLPENPQLTLFDTEGIGEL